MASDEQYNLVCKVETDGINASRIQYVVLYDHDRHISFTFSDQPGGLPIDEAVAILEATDGLIIVQSAYPLKMLRGVCRLKIDEGRVVDILELAKLFRRSGNGLDAWAREFGVQRSKFLGAEHCSPGVERHCEADCR
jgi:hypothetical protein